MKEIYKSPEIEIEKIDVNEDILNSSSDFIDDGPVN